MNQTLFLLLRQYSCLTPTNKIDLPHDVPRQKLQDFLIDKVLKDHLLGAYPPSLQYQRTFWKKVISHLETKYDEDEDFELSSEIYDHYVNVLQRSYATTKSPLAGGGPSNSYVTYYWEPPESFKLNSGLHSSGPTYLTTTLLESRNMIESGTTGLRTWTAAFFMARYFLEHPDLIANKRIVELGSGIGFMGIILGTLQALSQNSDTGAPKLWLTDVDDTVLSVCRRNVDLPCNMSSSHGGIEICKIDWFDSMDENSAPHLRALLRERMNPDLIVGSDIVFDPSLVVPLLSTIKLAIEGSERIAFLALTVRNPDTFAMFLSSARDLSFQVDELTTMISGVGSMLPNDVIEDFDAVRLLRFSHL